MGFCRGRFIFSQIPLRKIFGLLLFVFSLPLWRKTCLYVYRYIYIYIYISCGWYFVWIYCQVDKITQNQGLPH